MSLGYTLAGFIAALAVCALSVPAQAALTPAQAEQMQAYLAQSGRMLAPAADTLNAAQTLNEALARIVNSPDPALTTYTTAATGSDNDVATVTAPNRNLAILTLGAPESKPAGITYSLASGRGTAPVLPGMTGFDHNVAVAVTAAFRDPAHRTADSVARDAATPVTTDPALEERITLVRAIYHADGTDDLIRHFIATEHMRLIIGEVAKHIDFAKLSETDKYRLAAIAAVAQTELEEKVLRMSALMQAQNLNKAELSQLLAAFDNAAQRKLTALRLHDDGKVDRAAELDVRLAQYQIVKAFEAGR